MMYYQWIRQGKVGQDSGLFLDLGQWAGITRFFFHKKVSHLLGETMQFLNVETDDSVLYVLDCIKNEQENFSWLVVSFLPLCVSLLSAWAQVTLLSLVLASSLITLKMDERCCGDFSFESYSILLPTGSMNGEFDFWNEEFHFAIPKVNLFQISLLLLALWNFFPPKFKILVSFTWMGSCILLLFVFCHFSTCISIKAFII